MNNFVYADNTISWKDASNHYGKYMTVEGTIVSSKCFPKVCFLNFDKNYKTTLIVVIFASDLSKFPSNIDQYYLNKKVKVTGTIKKYKGKPEIIVKSQDQISINSTTTSATNKNPDELICFDQEDLQGGEWKWKGNKVCVERKYVVCEVDESALYWPLICKDKRNGWILSFSD